MNIAKIVSGGQTGVDQAALLFAIENGIDHGGWCPPGRTCEDGTIEGKFQLQETPVDRSEKASGLARSLRTEWNVRDSDGTLILTHNESNKDPGTLWTQQAAALYEKPVLVADPFKGGNYGEVKTWLRNNEIKILNVAGPSENTCPGIGAAVSTFLKKVFQDVKK